MSKIVLFVDDDELMLRALKREFSMDYDLTIAYSAAEAMELLKGSRIFDVVVSDVSMPGMNGLDLIEEAAPLNPLTRFVVLTGNCDNETLDRADEMTAVSRLLRKPCNREEIIAAIEHAANELASA